MQFDDRELMFVSRFAAPSILDYLSDVRFNDEMKGEPKDGCGFRSTEYIYEVCELDEAKALKALEDAATKGFVEKRVGGGEVYWKITEKGEKERSFYFIFDRKGHAAKGTYPDDETAWEGLRSALDDQFPGPKRQITMIKKVRAGFTSGKVHAELVD